MVMLFIDMVLIVACRHGDRLTAKLAGLGCVQKQLCVIFMCDCVYACGLMFVGEFVIMERTEKWRMMAANARWEMMMEKLVSSLDWSNFAYRTHALEACLHKT